MFKNNHFIFPLQVISQGKIFYATAGFCHYLMLFLIRSPAISEKLLSNPSIYSCKI